MNKLTLEQIAIYTDGFIYGHHALCVAGVSIDSRKVMAEDLFVALKGKSTDGHQHVLDGLKTCNAAIVEKHWAEDNLSQLPKGKALIAVADPMQALQNLARQYRQNLDIRVVGITGSTGKTTTKDLTSSVLAKSFNVHKTLGNFNNELGLPLTLLGIEARHEAAVLEMGMRAPGEIAFLAEMAKPEVGVITNIGLTHLELLGSQENIASAKGELLDSIPINGTAVLNGEDPWCRALGWGLERRVIYYGFEYPGAQLKGSNLKPWGELGITFEVSYGDQVAQVFLPLPGKHNAENALAAIGAGVALGMSLDDCVAGFSDFKMSGMRFEVCAGPRQSKIINDSYNANPASMLASIGVLAQRAGDANKIAVLGNMFELGAEEVHGHIQVGEAAAISKLDTLLTIGDKARLIAQGALDAGMEQNKIFSCEDISHAVDILRTKLVQGSWILIKGSRGMKMERVVEALLEM